MDQLKLKIIIKQIKLFSIITILSFSITYFSSDSKSDDSVSNMQTYITTAIEEFKKTSVANGTGDIRFTPSITEQMPAALTSWAGIKTVVPSDYIATNMANIIVVTQHKKQVKAATSSKATHPVDPHEFEL
jgi:hypothetical protein